MIAENIEDWTRQWLNQGIEQGIAQGIEQGKQEVLARILKRQLSHRFGPLPADAEARIDGAELEQLDACLDRVLEASSLDEVLR